MAPDQVGKRFNVPGDDGGYQFCIRLPFHKGMTMRGAPQVTTSVVADKSGLFAGGAARISLSTRRLFFYQSLPNLHKINELPILVRSRPSGFFRSR
jgi:hypothetical protein